MSDESEIRRAQYAEKQGEIVLREHEYDGIQEYDQKLPNWWLFIFIAANVFFIAYWIAYYQLGWLQPDAQKIEAAMVRIEQAKKAELEAMLSALNDENLVNTWSKDPERVAAGRATYLTNCTACHGADLAARMDIGGGQFINLSGLPLTDGQWKYGSRPMDIFKIIHDGTPPESPGHNNAKMEAWGLKLPPVQVAELTAFIISENAAEFSN